MFPTTERSNGKTKKERLTQDIARAVGAGRPVAAETVDFSDPNRPKTCLEVDFPILPINQIAAIEGKGSGALKPIYQTSKWWARRRSNVFRAMLLAAATKAPGDAQQAAKVVWDSYYGNHQRKKSLSHLRVADVFMGGGTTLVEGSRLGMKMYGNDLNPIAWFVVKQELSKVEVDDLAQLLAEVEAEVKPQIMPYYYCDGPHGQKGTWTHVPSGRVEGPDFDPLALTIQQRREYEYDGPEIIYTFWAKHGPCKVTGCGHRTPIMTSPVMAMKAISVKYWQHTCARCGKRFHIEAGTFRMAPDVPLYVSPEESPFSPLDPRRGALCPTCGHTAIVKLGAARTKTVNLSLLVHPQWLAGSPENDESNQPFGGSVQDGVEATKRWNRERASRLRLLEVRGTTDTVTCPETGVTFQIGKEGGTARKTSNYRCSACGVEQDLLDGLRRISKTAPVAAYAVQAYSKTVPGRESDPGGKRFAPFDDRFARQYDAACSEWETRKHNDLAPYWPKSTTQKGQESTRLLNHFYTEWWMLFNPRQLLVHTQLLKAIVTVGDHAWETRECVLGAFQQYLRNQCMFCFWNLQRALEPMFSNNDFHPKANVIENNCFSGVGRGDFASCAAKAVESIRWASKPWEIACEGDDNHSEKVETGDPVQGESVVLNCGSATDLASLDAASIDLIITDPPFGGLLQYAELSDFFYVWLRLVLRNRYPEIFGSELTPKTLEVVANKSREPGDSDGFYQRLLTQSWREAHRVLKPGGILAFTFHHSEDGPWVAVLESLFDAGFYLEATYPIRADETKGEGDFGSKTIEYDIIHVCRKRISEPTPTSWARLRREVLREVRQMTEIITLHQKQGLPDGDLKVIKRGKALEYFSRHYGKVYVDEGRGFSVRDALIGINQLLDEELGGGKEPPPVNAEPITRQFLRIFDGASEQKRDQVQKLLRGTTIDPKEYEGRGWCKEAQKVYHLVSPLDIAQEWYGKHRRRLTSDYDQAMLIIGASFASSGINVTDTLNNPNFRSHPALGRLLKWHTTHGATKQIRDAAAIAVQLYASWESQNPDVTRQLKLFFEDGEEG
jgi:adenine-specific DNA methylase